jgi:hypothetical protein
VHIVATVRSNFRANPLANRRYTRYGTSAEVCWHEDHTPGTTDVRRWVALLTLGGLI